jgi:outer membrane protein OmpA-like peptidoglycan-associated protein
MTIELDHYGDARLYRLAGEDAPIWLAAAFACLGVLLAIAASAQIFAAREMAAPLVESLAPDPQQKPKAETFGAAPSVASSGEVSGLNAFNGLKLARPANGPTPEGAEAPTSSIAAAFPAAESGADHPGALANCLPVVSIPFDRNSARPKIAGLAQGIAPLLDWLAAHQDAVISVEGHADSRGTERHNVLLSYSRAQAVKAWLARGGARESQLAVRAAGTLRPTNPPVAAESNRQVILQIEGVESCRNSGPAKTP